MCVGFQFRVRCRPHIDKLNDINLKKPICTNSSPGQTEENQPEPQ